MTVRRATNRDLKGILTLSKEWGEDGDPMDASVLQDYLLGEIVYCIEDADEILGVMLLEQNADGSIHIGRLFVHPDYQDEGLGSEMMQTLIEELLDKDHTHAFMSIAEGHPALSFYKRFGFTETNRFKPPSENHIALMRAASELSV